MQARPALSALIALFAPPLTAPLGAQVLDFARVDYAAGGDPSGIATADLDQDGRPDVALSDIAGNRVLVLYGQGGGTLADPALAAPVGTQPTALTAQDFDGDGLVDLATINVGSQDLSVLRNGPAGSFTALTATPVGGQPVGLAAADFDGDGDLDLATCHFGPSPSTALLFGHGDATFAPAVPFALPGAAFAMHLDAGDIDADGDIDLAVAVQNDWKLLSLVNGGSASTWTPVLSSSGDGYTERVSLGEIDGDAFPDLVVTLNDLSDRTVRALRGNGAGGFGPSGFGPLAFGASTFAHAMHDIDGDAALDVLVAPSSTPIYAPPAVQIFRGTGASLALTTAMQVPSTVRGFAVADVDGNGQADYAAAASPASEVAVFLQRNAVAPTIAGTTPSSVVSLGTGPGWLVLHGSGFTTLKHVALDGVPKPLAVVYGDTRVSVNLSNPAASSVALNVAAVTFVGTASTSVPVVPPAQPVLVGPASFSKFGPPSTVHLGSGAGDLVLIGGSFDLSPSSLPGVVDLAIGSGFSALAHLGTKVVPPVGWSTFSFSAAGLPTGQALHFQTAVLPVAGGLPLLTSNVASGTVSH